jgi:NADH-quinone oxidoreductase subunit J
MNIEALLFYIFSSIAIISGVMVISSRNPMHSVLFLVLVFCNAAGLLLLLETEFLAMLLLVVYVGAIAVLFLFVVMMLNIRLTELNEGVLRYIPIGGILLLIFLFELLSVVNGDLIPFFFQVIYLPLQTII